ncbi:MAG: flagellar basal body P-ring formation protein FlgA [Variibacter sp.]|nr:flagellar basal body P-ring formation protein FlgA [Variibacter sp.]
MRRVLSLLSAAAAFAVWATSVIAAGGTTPPVLKRDVTVSSEVVRIGDIVENSGALADIAIFRAPEVGETGAVSMARVIEALRPHGLADAETRGFAEIVVTRLGRLVGAAEIEKATAEAFAGRNGFGDAKDLTLTFDRAPRAFGMDEAAGDLKAVRSAHDPYSRRFDVTFEVAGSTPAKRLRYTGTIVETVELPVLTRTANRGDLIKAADIALERKPKAEVPPSALRDADKIIGLAARVPLRLGQPLRNADLMKPEIVRQNETVTLFFELPGMMLSARGKALESGAEGDTVNVLNLQSKQTIQGTVSGPNRVTVVSMAPRILALGPDDDAGAANRNPKVGGR